MYTEYYSINLDTLLVRIGLSNLNAKFVFEISGLFQMQCFAIAYIHIRSNIMIILIIISVTERITIVFRYFSEMHPGCFQI
jgi:hypothetical protein